MRTSILESWQRDFFFFTTLVIASSFVGLAGTKVNITKHVVKEKSSKEPQIQ